MKIAVIVRLRPGGYAREKIFKRFFCHKHHPEIDFDKEFETDQPGVFARYQEKFGYDYTDWEAQEKYNMLKEELAEKGYELPWD